MVKKKQDPLELTPEKIHSRISVLFFSTVALLVGIFLYSIRSINENYYTASMVLSILFFTGYFYLFVDFSLFYLTKANRWTRQAYKEHYLWFWGVAILIFVLIIAFALFHLLGKIKLLEIGGGTAIMVGLTGLWKVGVKIYHKYFKK